MNRRAIAFAMVIGLAACNDEGVDEPPIAVDDVITVEEDTPILIDVLANDSDPEGRPLRVTRADAGEHQVKIEGTRLRVTTARHWHGTIDAAYSLSDGSLWSAGRATITVTPVNDAPTARDLNVATGRNVAKLFELVGSDVEGDALTFEIESGPAHGTLSGTAPALTYTPASNFVGGDTLVFRVNDGSLSSAPAKINIQVVAGAAPVAHVQTVATAEDTSRAITLTANDQENDPLTFQIVRQPAHGTLAGTPPTVTYTPAADYYGTDSFEFVAEDGVLTSSPATVVINISAANDAPVAQPRAVAATEDQPVTFTLAGTDVDGNTLAYTIAQAPTRGTLSGIGATRTYTPLANLNGPDTFTFTVSDGIATSAPATVTIGVAPAEDPPAAHATSINVAEDSSRLFLLTGNDPDGDALTFTVATNPAHGTLTGTPPMLTYTPAANYNGTDSFTFTANDGDQTSAPVAISITVTAVNDTPVIAGAALGGNEGENITIPLPTTDIDGDTLTYSVVTFPAQGNVVLGATPYYNSLNHHGNVSFTLTASDGASTSAPATFTVAVASVQDAPSARDDIGIATAGQPLRLAVLANDLEFDGETLSLDSVTTPLHGTAQIDGDDVVYTTNAGNTAPDTFTYTVSDPTGLTATGTVTVGIGEFPSGLPVRHIGTAGDAGGSATKVPQHDISSDGRYIVFVSRFAVTAGDTNAANDIYLYDRMTATRERISVPDGGGLADGPSSRPSISGDGRYIAFASAATNLVPGDTNGTVDVFVRDRVAGTTTRASVGPNGAQVSGISRDPDISADGTIVAFVSTAFQLVPNDTNGMSDVFVRDLAAGVTTRVSIPTGGGEADQPSDDAVLSGDGNVVAFVSTATNLVVNDTNAKADVFVHDRTTGVTGRASVSSTGGQANNASGDPALSHDGRVVAFNSSANNLVTGTSTFSTRVYTHDRQTQATLSLDFAAYGFSLSGDGRYLVGHTSASHAFVRDRFAAETRVFSPSASANTWLPVISKNGRYVIVLTDTELDSQTQSAGTKVYVYPNPL